MLISAAAAAERSPGSREIFSMITSRRQFERVRAAENSRRVARAHMTLQRAYSRVRAGHGRRPSGTAQRHKHWLVAKSWTRRSGMLKLAKQQLVDSEPVKCGAKV